MIEPKPVYRIKFDRPCFNAHERGPPMLEREDLFSISALPAVKNAWTVANARHEQLITV